MFLSWPPLSNGLGGIGKHCDPEREYHMEKIVSCNFGRQWQLSLQFNLVQFHYILITYIYYASIMCSAAWVHPAWWDQSPMQNTVSIIAEGHCPARLINCLVHSWNMTASCTNAFLMSVLSIFSQLHCVSAHTFRLKCRWGGLLLFACYQQKIKACSGAWEMAPNSLSQCTHRYTPH